MPWKRVDPMEERLRFVLEAANGRYPIAALCRQFGISRKTGHKWLARYHASGLEGLREMSRAPKTCPHRTPDDILGAILDLRRQRPTWGPRKIVAKLALQGLSLPAPSTVGDLLKRAGLVEPRQSRRRVGVRSWPGTLTKPQKPNHVWAVDFKGWFRTRDGQPCHPLTVSDLHSRYLICCTPFPDQRGAPVEHIFHYLFDDYGLPAVIRVDNGTPFGSTGPYGLSSLSVGWMKHGIDVEFIRPGCPQDNGSHERMHRTLKAEAARPPESNMVEQAIRLERWRRDFNEQRPHEALGQRTPAQCYERSGRALAGSFQEFEYPNWYEQRRVRADGMIIWKGRRRFIGEAFVASTVGLIEDADGNHDVYLSELLLGVLQSNGSASLQPRGTRLAKPPTSRIPSLLPMYPV